MHLKGKTLYTSLSPQDYFQKVTLLNQKLCNSNPVLKHFKV